MPSYNYECESCAKILTQVHSMSSMPTEVSCDCGAMAYQVILKCPTMTGLSTQCYGWRDYEKYYYGDVIEMGDEIGKGKK